MKILDKAISDYVNEAGTYDKIVGTGIVLVSAPSVVLKGNKIAGSLLIAEGVGDGEFTLDGTNVAGTTTVRGGGVNS
ncbi:MAG: S-layer homology domain-containing protein, partial [Oscillospiraceae bacterium]